MVMGQSCVVPSNCAGLWQRGNHVLYLVTVQDYGRGQSKMDLLCMCVCTDCGGGCGRLWCPRRHCHWWHCYPQWQLPTCRLVNFGWSWISDTADHHRKYCVCTVVWSLCIGLTVWVQFVCMLTNLCKAINKKWIMTHETLKLESQGPPNFVDGCYCGLGSHTSGGFCFSQQWLWTWLWSVDKP